jgi:ABC-2 type transport system ATP-binding protein
LPGHLRAVEYLDLLGKICRLPGEVRKPRLTSLLRAVGLLAATNQRIQTFSTGMCTRLGIAASLMADPPLLLWDEPTAGLDPAARRFTLDLIREMGKTRTVVIATHILSDIDQICDHVGVMHEGRMIFSGPMRDMKRRLVSNEFRLDLDGSEQGMEELAGQVRELDGVADLVHDKHILRIQTSDGRGRARVLAEILRLVDASDLSLHSIQSGQNETEHAYLQLLQEDRAHGFQRFDIDAPDADDAYAGDTSP